MLHLAANARLSERSADREQRRVVFWVKRVENSARQLSVGFERAEQRNKPVERATADDVEACVRSERCKSGRVDVALNADVQLADNAFFGKK